MVGYVVRLSGFRRGRVIRNANVLNDIPAVFSRMKAFERRGEFGDRELAMPHPSLKTMISVTRYFTIRSLGLPESPAGPHASGLYIS
jgi:hypothetical protein